MRITFLLNGEIVDSCETDPTQTLLDWLRIERRLCGTKEGCNEGDCGACTVLVMDDHGGRAVNACILFLPQLHGKAVRTIEGIKEPDGALHPVQSRMIEKHGSQCGFCTPGIVMSLVAAHGNGRRDFDQVLAGNLCRCTGYAPIIRAAEAAADVPVARWMAKDKAALKDLVTPVPEPLIPESADDLAGHLARHPEARIVAGATDVGLWVTKALRDIKPVVFLHRCRDLQSIDNDGTSLVIGAGVTIEALLHVVAPLYPSLAQMLTRYGSVQVRNAATLGGNIANGSPIGDSPPALIALNARLILRKSDVRREILLEDFFVDYGKQDRQSGEFIEAIHIPHQPDQLKCYKLSKRFDQDISALCGCFYIAISDQIVTHARIAFGGMAATPRRAYNTEKALIGQSWSVETVHHAQKALGTDFTPISDMRASALYRMEAACNMLARYFAETQGQITNVREVAP